jgi:predicted RNase H-like HicB family nuclease
MHYPVAIEPGSAKAAWGVVVPDLPGCFSAGDTLEEALLNTEEAIIGWIGATLDEGQDIPAHSAVEELRERHTALQGWIWAVVKVDPYMRDDMYGVGAAVGGGKACVEGTSHPSPPRANSA